MPATANSSSPGTPAGLTAATGLTRRRWLYANLGLAGLLLDPRAALALPERPLQFPRDHGSHPDFQTEWWYVTGALTAANADPAQAPSHGFQLTFFRSRVASTQALQSAFAAKQLLFAHAAVTDLASGRLLHSQRIARAGMGLAEAGEHDMALHIDDWQLRSPASGRHLARAHSDELALDLTLVDTQPLLLQGRQGLSRKGPRPEQASYYYSRPQLQVQGQIRAGGPQTLPLTVRGRAWLDHEWSQALLDREAEGWDWIGINLHNGSALTAFQLRRPDGSALWTGGSWREAGGAVQAFGPDRCHWQARRDWRSPRSDTRYPVEWRLQTPAGDFVIQAVLEDQELDASTSTGGIYWEGLCRLLDARGPLLGYGYLEMTGYHRALHVG